MKHEAENLSTGSKISGHPTKHGTPIIDNPVIRLFKIFEEIKKIKWHPLVLLFVITNNTGKLFVYRGPVWTFQWN